MQNVGILELEYCDVSCLIPVDVHPYNIRSRSRACGVLSSTFKMTMIEQFLDCNVDWM